LKYSHESKSAAKITNRSVRKDIGRSLASLSKQVLIRERKKKVVRSRKTIKQRSICGIVD
jgi:hypothetical protein